MKLAVLFTRLSGYMAACLESFRAQTGAQLLLFVWPPHPNAPFVAGSFSHLGKIFDRSQLGERQIEQHLLAFQPDAILAAGWIDPGYRRICRRFKGAGVPVIAGCDTQWRASLRQFAAAYVVPWYVHRFIDVLWVSGERQRCLAQALGYRGARCWDGFYACDWQRFARSAPRVPSARPHAFLFTGRYIEEKGIRNLAEAYRIYRSAVEDPWPLVCAGKGELASLLTAAGADDRGFVQPEGLPELMHQASSFVLPSLFEPWGVVVQEAAATGLPLIVSDACGAGVHLVRDGYNGFITAPGDARNLAGSLIQMHRLSEAERQEFGQRSFELSKQYTPDRWAKTLQMGIGMLRADLAGSSGSGASSQSSKRR